MRRRRVYARRALYVPRRALPRVDAGRGRRAVIGTRAAVVAARAQRLAALRRLASPTAAAAAISRILSGASLGPTAAVRMGLACPVRRREPAP